MGKGVGIGYVPEDDRLVVHCRATARIACALVPSSSHVSKRKSSSWMAFCCSINVHTRGEEDSRRFRRIKAWPTTDLCSG